MFNALPNPCLIPNPTGGVPVGRKVLLVDCGLCVAGERYEVPPEAMATLHDWMEGPEASSIQISLVEGRLNVRGPRGGFLGEFARAPEAPETEPAPRAPEAPIPA